jgi:transposase-like protein
MQRKEEMISMVLDFEKSGMSLKAYASQVGVPYYRLQYWWRKFNKKEKAFEPKAASFLPIALTESQKPKERHPQVELVLPGGLKLTIF